MLPRSGRFGWSRRGHAPALYALSPPLASFSSLASRPDLDKFRRHFLATAARFPPDSSEKPHPSGQHCFSFIPACYPPRASGRYGPPNTCERSLPFAVRYTSVAAELSDPLPNLFQRSPLSISPASAEATATR